MTVRVVLAATSPKEQLKRWGLPLIEHPCTEGFIDQLRPVPEGNVSLRVTLVAVPGPALLMVIVKVMRSPVLTEACSAVLKTDRLGGLTVIVSVSVTSPLLSARASPVLPIKVGLLNVVGLTM